MNRKLVQVQQSDIARIRKRAFYKSISATGLKIVPMVATNIDATLKTTLGKLQSVTLGDVNYHHAFVHKTVKNVFEQLGFKVLSTVLTVIRTCLKY